MLSTKITKDNRLQIINSFFGHISRALRLLLKALFFELSDTGVDVLVTLLSTLTMSIQIIESDWFTMSQCFLEKSNYSVHY